jgi:hypothetical protein
VFIPIFFLIASFVFFIAGVYFAVDFRIALFCLLCAVACASAGIVETYYYIRSNNIKLKKSDHIARHGVELNILEARIAFINKVKELTSEQTAVIGKFTALIEVETTIGPEAEPDYTLHIGDAVIKWEVVDEFVRNSQGDYLAPIGDYGEGSKKRMGIQAIHGYLIANGFADWVGGPKGTIWRDKARGLRAIGVRQE